MASSTTHYVLVFFLVACCSAILVQAYPDQLRPQQVQSWPGQRQERPERPQKGLQLQHSRPPGSGAPVLNSFGEGVIEDVLVPAASNQFQNRRSAGGPPSSGSRPMMGDQEDLDGASSALQNRRGGGGRPFGVIGEDIDNEPSATGHHGHHHGRVQIKVYRGQSKGHGWESFAPYGYWVRQPPDNHGHHHGY